MARQWTVQEEKALRDLAARGMPAVYIAKHIDRTRWAVINRAQSLGLKLKYPSGDNFKGTTVPDYYVQAIRVLHQHGLNSSQISDIFKQPHRVSEGYVRRICCGTSRTDAGETS